MAISNTIVTCGRYMIIEVRLLTPRELWSIRDKPSDELTLHYKVE